MQIPFLKPNIVKTESILKYFLEIEENRIYSNYGPLNTRFEKQILNDYFDNIGLVTTVNNATSGLILAISESKRPKGKYALMPSFTFAATPLAAKWCGLEPYFVDIDPNSWCMSETLVTKLIENLGDQIAVVIPYAVFGTHMDLSYYSQIHHSGIPVVVDAAASFGASEADEQFGKGFPGLIAYSFHATKSFGIGEGGIVYSANADSVSNVRQSGNFGFSSQRESVRQGLNSKMAEYSSAIGLATLDHFPSKIAKRTKIYEWYIALLNQNGLLESGWVLQNIRGRVPHQFMSILCPENTNNMQIERLLSSHQIEARTYFSPPCHQQEEFRLCSRTDLPITDQICQRIISLPLWEEMIYEDVVRIVNVLSTV